MSKSSQTKKTGKKRGQTKREDISAVRAVETVLSHEKLIKELQPKPHRNPFIHWTALILSLFSLGLLISWMVSGRGQVTTTWFVIDIVLGVIFFFEFFSRSGFRWNPTGYTFTRFFDFIAIVPVLALIDHGIPEEMIWVWFVLVARAARAIDRVLGDGFISRNFFALVEGFEEEITDRVLLRIIERVQTDLERGHFGAGIAKAMEQNKPDILRRIGAQHPFEGTGSGIAHLIGVGLDVFLRRTEEHIYDAAVNVLNSPEIDRAIRDSVNSIFDTMQVELAKKTWHQHLGFGGEQSRQEEPKSSEPENFEKK